MDFKTVAVTCSEPLKEVLIASLFELQFDSFQEFDDGFEASCPGDLFSQQALEEALALFEGVEYSVKEQDKVNWNEEWEKNYDAIVVEDQCIVRATFHDPAPQFPYEIVISPKMSFGTGHHATTYQVLAYQMALDFSGKKVLDVGCGTGVLAIMAAKRGAAKLVATDIDDWCIENSTDNFALNQVENVQMIQGQIDLVNDHTFDVVLANINKNVLLEQIPAYCDRLVAEGTLILSGFYEEDSNEIRKAAEAQRLTQVCMTVRDRWAMIAFRKPSI